MVSLREAVEGVKNGRMILTRMAVYNGDLSEFERIVAIDLEEENIHEKIKEVENIPAYDADVEIVESGGNIYAGSPSDYREAVKVDKDGKIEKFLLESKMFPSKKGDGIVRIPAERKAKEMFKKVVIKNYKNVYDLEIEPESIEIEENAAFYDPTTGDVYALFKAKAGGMNVKDNTTGKVGKSSKELDIAAIGRLDFENGTIDVVSMPSYGETNKKEFLKVVATGKHEVGHRKYAVTVNGKVHVIHMYTEIEGKEIKNQEIAVRDLKNLDKKAVIYRPEEGSVVIDMYVMPKIKENNVRIAVLEYSFEDQSYKLKMIETDLFKEMSSPGTYAGKSGIRPGNVQWNPLTGRKVFEIMEIPSKSIDGKYMELSLVPVYTKVGE